MTDESLKPLLAALVLLAVVAAASLAGCAGSAPAKAPAADNQSQDAYVDAYCTGMGYHSQGQDDFNNGTLAWESSDFRTAIADYRNASAEYGAAADAYTTMGGYANNSSDREFAGALQGTAYNMSLASDNFMNAAIALGQNNTDQAYARFGQGQACLNASDMLLNRSIDLTPDWLKALASASE